MERKVDTVRGRSCKDETKGEAFLPGCIPDIRVEFCIPPNKSRRLPLFVHTHTHLLTHTPIV